MLWNVCCFYASGKKPSYGSLSAASNGVYWFNTTKEVCLPAKNIHLWKVISPLARALILVSFPTFWDLAGWDLKRFEWKQIAGQLLMSFKCENTSSVSQCNKYFSLPTVSLVSLSRHEYRRQLIQSKCSKSPWLF